MIRSSIRKESADSSGNHANQLLLVFRLPKERFLVRVAEESALYQHTGASYLLHQIHTCAFLFPAAVSWAQGRN